MCQKRFKRTRKTEDLEEAIQGIQQLLEDPPQGLNLAAYLVSLVGLLKERYERTQNLEDLDKAIQALQQLPEVAPANQPDPRALACLVILLQERYDRTQKLEDLDKAIQGLQQLLEDPAHDLNLKALGSLVKLLQERYECTGKLEDLDKAIQVLQQLLEVASTNQISLAVLACLAILLQEKYDCTQKLEDLEEAIRGLQKLLEACPKHESNLILTLLLQDPYKGALKLAYLEEVIQAFQQVLVLLPKEPFILAVFSGNLADMLRKRFELTGRMEDKDEAIRSSQQGIRLISKDYLNLASLMMSYQYFKRYERTGKIEDIEEAARLSEHAVKLTPEDHPLLPIFIRFANALDTHFIRTGKTEYLEGAIRLSEQAVELTSTYHPNRPEFLDDLVRLHLRRYDYTGRLDDLGQAIKLSQRAVELTPPGDHSRLATHRSSLAQGLLRQFERTWKIEGLEEAVRLSEQALELTFRDHPGRVVFLNNLASLLQRRYQCIGKIDDLEKAIELSQQAVQLTPRQHPNYIPLLNSMGGIILERHERTGKMEDIEEAIELAQQTLMLTPKDHYLRACFLGKLGSRLGRRYDHTGKLDDLDKAIEMSQQAVALTPTDHPNHPFLLSDAGCIMERSHGRTGKMEDLEEAIRLSREAIKLAPKDHPCRAEFFGRLGVQLMKRSGRTGRTEDLEEAVHLSQQAVDILPRVHRSHLALYLGNRAHILGSRFQRTQNRNDLEDAIEVSRQIVEFLPKDHPFLGHSLYLLGVNLRKRYKITNQIEDLEEAIGLTQQAVELIPKNELPLSANCLSDLARMLRDRSIPWLTGIKDIEKAIELSHQAVELTPDDHPDLALHYMQLGLHYLSLFIYDIDKGLKYMLQAWNCTSGSLLIRIRAASMALLLLQQRKDYDSAYTLSLQVLDLLPHVRNRSLGLQDQQYVASHFSGLAVDACSYALKKGKPSTEALELLERGRGVIISLLMDDRSEASALQAADPDLYELYERLKVEVNMPTDEDMFQPQQASLKKRPNAIKELEGCIEDIRKLPGFGLFEKGLTTEQIKQASDDGSIIIVNVSTVRSDAIVVTSTGVNSVPLPGLDEASVRAWGLQDLTTESGNRGMKNKTYRQFLAWLWHQCVRPVLDEHQYLGQLSVESPPRVWWIGTGLASSFPFHAAGDDTAGPAENTYSHVISSYTPSIKALLYSKKQAVKICAPSYDPLKLLVVSMAQTPGARDLPAVKKETAVVVEALKESVRIEMLDQPDTAKVMHHLRHCKIAHFACHGVSNSTDPSQSGLVLQAGTAEPRQDILSVRDIFKSQHLQGAVAYLSACSAAENRVDELVDEVLHVVSCFQVAGFRHVIGCLWPSDDNVCVEVAKCFYSAICQNGNLDVDDRTIALALHQAVKEISKSDEYRKRPLHWAQFVHYGA
ncbi:hypothetical protein CNMCM5623_004429 [Aspergillus felis]|uniref:CHAT domain-containing protein n=1 Tax=Aspergillus felis TaxID=1287682 RepID=A0A8H6QGQ7_9EURO|nr:hypothetical protein CNMCM5623_004429 [Aspergillus felis]